MHMPAFSSGHVSQILEAIKPVPPLVGPEGDQAFSEAGIIPSRIISRAMV